MQSNPIARGVFGVAAAANEVSSRGAPLAEWPSAEAEELSAELFALLVDDEECDPPGWQAPLPCPPHHWLIRDGSEPGMLALTCVRCGSVREQPRDTGPDWRNRLARRQGNVPAPSFSQAD